MRNITVTVLHKYSAHGKVFSFSRGLSTGGTRHEQNDNET